MSKSEQKPRSGSRNWYLKHFGPARMAQRPLDIPESYLLVELSSSQGRPLLLCPVNKANKLPKSTPCQVQFMFEGWEPDVNKSALLGVDGVIHRVQPRCTQ
jgi:hypothetical protein